jgi:hypothetical protein
MSKAIDKLTSTRRRFLRLAGSTAVATAFLAAPVIAATPAAPATAPPDPLIALAVAVRKADRRAHRAWDARDEAEVVAAGGRGHWLRPWVQVGKYMCHSPSMVLGAAQPNDPEGPSAEEGQALAAELRRKIRAYHRRRLAAGLGPCDREVKEAERGWNAAMEAIAATPATTVAGIAAELRVIRNDFADGETGHSGSILRSALRDAERLAGKAVQS